MALTASPSDGMPIDGYAAPGFQRVREAFVDNFRLRDELGAAVAVYCKGKCVVDLWGGYKDVSRTQAWERDSIVCIMSVTKSLAAIAVLMLVDRGQVNLEACVSVYWPEFAQSGKAQITVRQILGGLGGLVYLDHASAGALVDWDAMIKAIELQEPHWPPGTRGAYHSVTQGFLLGELVRRVDGRRIEAFVRDEITEPLGIEFLMGLNTDELERVIDLVPNPCSVTGKAIGDPLTKIGRAWKIQPPVVGPLFNSEEFRRAVIPSGSGHSNARSVARIFAVLAEGGEIDGVRLLSRSIVDEARTAQWDGTCGLTDRNYRYGLGFFIHKPPLMPFGSNPRAFGHFGAGGAVGFADTEARLAFSYSPNFMCSGEGLGDRCEALIAAL